MSKLRTLTAVTTFSVVCAAASVKTGPENDGPYATIYDQKVGAQVDTGIRIGLVALGVAGVFALGVSYGRSTPGSGQSPVRVPSTPLPLAMQRANIRNRKLGQ